MEMLKQWAESLRQPEKKAEEEARARWDSVAKPLDGLGLFESMLVKIAGITGTADIVLDKAAVLVLCADNGVVAEGVTQTDSSVTAAVAKSLANGTANVNRMAATAGVDVIPIDIGIAEELDEEGLLRWNARHGTGNIRIEPAMTEKEVLFAITGGVTMVQLCKSQGNRLLLTGEMGIGNTTTSAALAAALLDLPVEAVTGRGAGLSAVGLEKKRKVITDALRRAGKNDVPKDEEAFRLLLELGGLDIAGLVGIFLGGALWGVPIIIDGVVTGIAAVLAERMFPGCREFMLPSHLGKEPAMKAIYDELSLSPVIHGELALGEGTGAVMLVPLLRMALAVYQGCTSFSDIKIEPYQRFDNN